MKTQFFAGYCLSDLIRKESSSGGIYGLLADEMIQRGGVVYAVCYDEKMEAVYREIRTIDKIKESQGAKYLCAHLGDTFRQLVMRLDEGCPVLFVGTPCHCAGLLSFLKMGSPDKGRRRRKLLLCVDFVCHGVPGLAAWRGYLNSLKRRGISPVTVNLRDKGSGWSYYHYRVVLTDQKGRKWKELREDNPFLTGFAENLYLRPSCYSCPFKGTERETDLTLGDCWGIWDIDPQFDDDKGVSLILVHTPAGEQWFGNISTKIRQTMVDAGMAVKNNICMVSSVECPAAKRREFFGRLAEGQDFIQIVWELTGMTPLRRLKKRLKRLMGFE